MALEQRFTTPSEQCSTTLSEQCSTTLSEQCSTTPSEQRSTTLTRRPTTTLTRRPTATPTRRPTATPTRRPTARQTVGLRLDKCNVYDFTTLQKVFSKHPSKLQTSCVSARKGSSILHSSFRNPSAKVQETTSPCKAARRQQKYLTLFYKETRFVGVTFFTG